MKFLYGSCVYWCWSWNSNTLATSCEELTHWKRPWWWEGLGAGGEGDDRGWDVWMASSTRWAWVWVNSGSCWWTGRPGVLWFMRSQRVGHDWATELNWTELCAVTLLNSFTASNHLLIYDSFIQNFLNFPKSIHFFFLISLHWLHSSVQGCLDVRRE